MADGIEFCDLFEEKTGENAEDSCDEENNIQIDYDFMDESFFSLWMMQYSK